MANEPGNQVPPGIEDIFAQFKDLFGDFFSGKTSAAATRGADLRHPLELSHVEARDGVKKDIAVERGVIEDGALVRRTQTITVSVPAGVHHGTILRLLGRGDEKLDGPPGHLYLPLEVMPLGVPRRQGSDTTVDVGVGLRQLLIGGSVVVPTLDGPQRVRVPRRVKDGDRVTLSGRGAARAPTGDGPYRGAPRGDVHVVFRTAPSDRELAVRLEVCAVLVLAFVALGIVLALG